MAKSDILISPARIYYAPIGETLPDETSVAYGAAWGGNWVDLGYTTEATSMNLETESFDLKVQQSIAVIKSVRTGLDATIETVLAEFSGANLALVLDATKTTTAAGASQKGFDSIVVSGEKVDMSNYLFGLEGFRVHSTNARLPVRIFVQGTITTNGGIEFAKDAAAGIPVKITAMADASGNLITIHNVTAPASS